MKTVDLEYKNFKLLVLDRRKNADKKLISKYSEKIFNLLKGAYEHIDGCEIYENKEDMKSKATIYKIVINDKEEIYGAATYRYLKPDNSYKCVLIGRNFEYDKEDGKTAVQWIIKSDIKNWKKYYWIEAFGRVADWEEEYGAFKIPANYVPYILNDVVDNSDFILDPQNEYKYYRKIKGHKDLKPKIMFGFNSKETLDKFLEGENYDKYDKLINDLLSGKIHNSLYEKRVEKFNEFCIESVLRAIDFIEDRYDEQNEFRNVSPKLLKTLELVCKKTEELINSKNVSKTDKEELEFKYEICKKITQKANVIIPHKLFEK